MYNLLSAETYKRYIAYKAKKGEYNEMALIYVHSLLQDLKPANIRYLHDEGAVGVSEGEIKPTPRLGDTRKIDNILNQWRTWKQTGHLPYWSTFDDCVDKMRTGGISPVSKRSTAAILDYINSYERENLTVEKESELEIGEVYIVIENQGSAPEKAVYAESAELENHFKAVGVDTSLQEEIFFWKQVERVQLLPPSDEIIEKTFKQLRNVKEQRVKAFISSLDNSEKDNSEVVEKVLAN